MKVWFKNSCRSTRIRSGWVRRLVGQVLRIMKQENAEVGIMLVGDTRMRTLNRRYRGIDRTTDVLAFALQDKSGPDAATESPMMLGDVVISLDTARRQAYRHRHAFERELAILMIHGLLHLMGYDHERSESEARRMQRRERQLLRLVNGSGRPAKH